MNLQKKVIPPAQARQNLYGGIVWIVGASALSLYGLLIFLETSVPGVEELVHFLSSLDGRYIFLAVFISTFIEGLYVIGTFFPGSTLIVILAILSQQISLTVFSMTIVSIFLSWCMAGGINIIGAKYLNSLRKMSTNPDYAVRDQMLTTWFPSFRANYEVAQVVEGGKPIQVFLSSVKVRFWASVFAGVITYISALFIDLGSISNEEGMVTLLIVAVISFIVGFIKIRSYVKSGDVRETGARESGARGAER